MLQSVGSQTVRHSFMTEQKVDCQIMLFLVVLENIKNTILNPQNIGKQKAVHVLTCISMIPRENEFFHVLIVL